MNFKENFNSPGGKKPENPNQKLVIFNEQLTEAIKQEDYEQAAVLRDLISKRKQDPTLEFYKKDFIKPTESGIYVFRKGDPRHRAWRGMSERKQKSYWDGIKIIQDYEFSDCLTSGPRTAGILGEKGWNKVRKMQGVKGAEKIDFILDLQSHRNEMQDIVNLAEEKFNNIWQPYCEKNGLPISKFKELHSTYNNHYGFTDDRIEVLNRIPEVLREPLNYWQRVYDNSRIILDELGLAIDKLNE